MKCWKWFIILIIEKFIFNASHIIHCDFDFFQSESKKIQFQHVAELLCKVYLLCTRQAEEELGKENPLLTRSVQWPLSSFQGYHACHRCGRQSTGVKRRKKQNWCGFFVFVSKSNANSQSDHANLDLIGVMTTCQNCQVIARKKVMLLLLVSFAISKVFNN